jgi:hypothetical protein
LNLRLQGEEGAKRDNNPRPWQADQDKITAAQPA